jgi:hypothetical protein
MQNSDILTFDNDGEVTIESLKKAVERSGIYGDLSNAKTLRYLNEELKAGKYQYDKALDEVLKFNRSSQFRDGFMATLNKENDGKYSISVVERTPDAEYRLADHIENKLVTDALRTMLKNMGLSVEFLDNATHAVNYSTKNVHLDVDGLYAVAKVLNGINTSKEVAEVAGHFITAALKGTPLIERLVSALDTETQRALFRNPKSEFFRDDFIVSELSAREAAGILLGKELLKPFEEASINKKAKVGMLPRAIKNLLVKIGNFVKRVFGIKPDEVTAMVQKARKAASTAAQGYLSEPELLDTDIRRGLDADETFTAGTGSQML